MCGETHIPRDMCAGNTIPGETHITVTPAHHRLFKGVYSRALRPLYNL